MLNAIALLQRAIRRNRWNKLFGKKIPLARGPFGIVAFPVLSKSFELEGVQGSTRDYVGTSFGMPAYHRTRLVFIAILEWSWFENLSLITVVINCVMLALEGPPNRESTELALLDFSFTIIFTVELLLRTAAMGFMGHKQSYLSNAWNQLDCFVVVVSWLPLIFPSLGKVSSIRAVRALRPLRTINRLPELKKQVVTLLASLPQLIDVAMLIGFLMVVFGVLGLQLFKGTLRYRCYEHGAEEPIDPVGITASGVCAPALETDASLVGRGSCDEGQLCKDYGVNPLYGTVSFDSIARAWSTIYQVVTLEGWIDVLYMTIPVGGAMSVIYFIALVIFGAFYVLNLFLAGTLTPNPRPFPKPFP